MRKIVSLIMGMMLITLTASSIPILADEYHSVYGKLYINDALAPSGVEVKLSFDGDSITDETDSNGYYQIDFPGHENETGYFYIYYEGIWRIPVDNQSVEICPDIVGYNIDLHINTSSPPDTVYVDDDFNSSTPGWGYDHFDSIQDGVDAVNEGGTVYVYNGTYYENVIVDKTISLVGEDRDTTIIDGVVSGAVVYVSANGVNISGFMIQNSGSTIYDAGIELHSNYTNISDNNISNNNKYGIWLRSCRDNNISDNILSSNNIWCIFLSASSNNIITGNVISDNRYGIYLYSSNDNVISDNNIYSNSYDGISLGGSSNNNMILGNIISDRGITVSAPNNTILNNNIHSGYYGIILANSNAHHNVVSGNTICNNSFGIELFYLPHNNTISGNNIISNTLDGINIDYSSINNVLYHNNFINNQRENAYDGGNNIWDNGYPSGGNYWDDYNGTDADADGMGDTPYNISGGSNQDLYPLMIPYGPPHADFIYTINDKTVYVNASTSYDYDGNITNYEWDFGDETKKDMKRKKEVD